MKLPFKETIFFDIGLAILIILAILVLFFILKRILLLFRKKNDKKKVSGFGCLIKFLLFCVFFWFAVSLISLSAFLQSFQSLAKQKLVAEIIGKPIDSEGYTIRLTFIQKYGDQANIPRYFYLKGDRWFIEGDILKWENWVNFLGLHTMFRIKRVGGSYWRTADELSQPHTIQNLVKDELPPNWQWLYKLGASLPFVQDVYSISIAKPPVKNKIIKLYITTSGFSTEPIDME